MGEFLGLDLDLNDLLAMAKKAKLKLSDLLKLLPADQQEKIKQAQRDFRDKRDEWIDAAASSIGDFLIPDSYQGFWRLFVSFWLMPMLKDKLGAEWDKMTKSEVLPK